MSQGSSYKLGLQIEGARDGDPTAMTGLLDTYRTYLMLLARLQIDGSIQARVSASDAVQDTFLQARQSFAEFRGTTEVELTAWLRRILASTLAMLSRRHRAQRRDIRREQRLTNRLDESSTTLAEFIPSAESSPSQKLQRREQAVLLAQALSQLPHDHQQIIIAHHLQSQSFPEIANKMGRSIPSVKSMWARAITKMRAALVEGAS